MSKGSIPVQTTHNFLLWLYSEYSRYVYKLAWQITSNKADVDDLVQEVWVRLCSKGDLLVNFSKERHLSYINTTIKNTAISIARRQTTEWPLEFADTLSYDETEILNALFDRQMKIHHFQKLWCLVPSAARELLERKYILLETDEEIARNLGIKASSVRMYLTRARNTACAILSQYKGDLI